MERRILRKTDSRLGRHVEHDPRSVRYAFPVYPKSAIKSALWTRRAPILDQGNLGSCTGNALAGILGTDAEGYQGLTTVYVPNADAYKLFVRTSYVIDEAFAIQLYKLNTLLDSFKGEYPPTDTGSSGLACGKSAVALGLADTYSHAFSFGALQSAIQHGPVLFGTVWLNSMFETASDGHVRVQTSSGVAGGHELIISGYDASAGTWQLANSWGSSWGFHGHGYVTDNEMKWLLSQQGDVTVPHLVSTAPEPSPDPTPAPSDAVLYAQVKAWAKAKGLES